VPALVITGSAMAAAWIVTLYCLDETWPPQPFTEIAGL
jgi:hypothetical protein